ALESNHAIALILHMFAQGFAMTVQQMLYCISRRSIDSEFNQMNARADRLQITQT
ncbi:hypothetical protein M9458_035674, partial [Cirrhinus mrigala]